MKLGLLTPHFIDLCMNKSQQLKVHVGSLACFAESQSQLSHLLRGRGDGFGIGKV